MSKYTHDYELDNGQWVEVEYEYDPGEPMIHTYPNGDPGHPGSAPSVNIYAAYAEVKDKNGLIVSVNIWPYLCLDDQADIEEKLYNQHEE